MQHPGRRVQADVQFAPKACHVGEAEGKQFCQYTATDGYGRFRHVEAFEGEREHNSVSLQPARPAMADLPGRAIYYGTCQ